MRTKRFRMAVTVFLLTGVAFCGLAEQATLEQQVEWLRRQAHRAEEQVKTKTDGVLDLDRQIEAKIDDVVELVTSIRDSTDSKTHVTGVKKDIIDGLQNSIAFYRQRRAGRIAALRTGASAEPADYNDGAIRFLDDRVDKRVEQILEVTASLTQHKEWKRSEKHYRSKDYDGGNRSSDVETTEYRQYDKNRSQSEREKTDVAEALVQDADKLTAENRSLRQSLAYVKTDEAKARIEAQIKRNEETAEKRRGQVRSTLTDAKAPGKSLSRQAAFETGRWISDLVQGIGKDHRELVRLATERKQSVAQLKLWQDRLSRAEAALAAQARTSAP